jgi:hypothetical protein
METNKQTTALAAPVAFGEGGIQIRTMGDAMQFANLVLQSGIAPKSLQTPAAIIVAIQAGAELGWGPMQSIQSIAVINGKPTLYGDALPARGWGSGVLEEMDEWYEIDGRRLTVAEEAAPITDQWTACCLTRRKGQAEPVIRQFSVTDAKQAKLWAKPGPWQDYQKRMLRMRARGFNFRDNLADVLRGMAVFEEVRDYRIIPSTDSGRRDSKPVPAMPQRASAMRVLPAATQEVAEIPPADDQDYAASGTEVVQAYDESQQAAPETPTIRNTDDAAKMKEGDKAQIGGRLARDPKAMMTKSAKPKPYFVFELESTNGPVDFRHWGELVPERGLAAGVEVIFDAEASEYQGKIYRTAENLEVVQ